jgi:hypothetical protein
MTLKMTACHDCSARDALGKGERMTEDGILGIMKRGNTYQVRYASYNPHGIDRPLYQCPDESTLVALLRRCGMDPWYIHQAGAELQKGGFVALPIALAEAQIHTYFSPQTCTAGEHESSSRRR